MGTDLVVAVVGFAVAGLTLTAASRWSLRRKARTARPGPVRGAEPVRRYEADADEDGPGGTGTGAGTGDDRTDR